MADTESIFDEVTVGSSYQFRSTINSNFDTADEQIKNLLENKTQVKVAADQPSTLNNGDLWFKIV